MEPVPTSRSGRVSSYERLVAIVLTVVAVFSPLYINRKPDSDWEDDEQTINLVSLAASSALGVDSGHRFVAFLRPELYQLKAET
ncbi:hypothetical protein Dsin_017959 [Dipteronia sinensis]|uniref:Uncharacterized protein n=1 Tax=Dipteronia sinensis TaxID=43782 RepID=A0AAE0AGY2_9ROSI|nr:hypothetical protein Dsin_017959 [Dipteronia sinensis]